MKKTHKVVMLPTTKSNKVGDIVLNDAKTLETNQVRLAQLNVLTVNSDQPCTNQHLYFTTNDEIKEGDWFINFDGVWQYNIVKPNGSAKKIVATTDNSLMIDI